MIARTAEALRAALVRGFTHVLVNIGALDAPEYETLLAGVPRRSDGRVVPRVTMCTFQETYSPAAYARFMGTNPENPRSDFARRLTNFDRACDAGMWVANPGVLLGLNPDVAFELLALVAHVRHLRRRGMEAYVSLPRLRKASGTPYLAGVSDDLLCRAVAVLSMGLPEVKVVISTREPPAMQRRLLPVIGVLTPGSPGVAPYTWRWKVLLAGLGARPRLAALVGYRAAGQSLSSLIPSGKLGGEPLRTLLLARGGVGAAQAIAAVAVDRTLEMGGAAAFACAYALVLLRRGVLALEGALVTVSLGAAALTLGVALTVQRLRRGAGLVTALARSSGLTRLAFVRQQMDVLGAAEEEAARLIAQPQRMARAFALGLAANLLVLGEYALLLAAFGLPSGPVAVVAAVFATGAAHSLPIPAAVGALEGAELWLFGMLGHPPAVGLAVGLVVRLREVAWIVPGILYLMMRAPGLTRGALTTPPDPCTRAPEPPPARAVPMRGGGGG